MLASLDQSLYGVASIPNAGRVPCFTFPIRHSDLDVSATVTRSDWIGLAVPMEGLARVLEVGAYPFDDGSSLEWRQTIQSWMRELAQRAYEAHRFQLALIEWDCTAEVSRADIEEKGIPAERWYGYVLPEGTLLRWYPPVERAKISF